MASTATTPSRKPPAVKRVSKAEQERRAQAAAEERRARAEAALAEFDLTIDD